MNIETVAVFEEYIHNKLNDAEMPRGCTLVVITVQLLDTKRSCSFYVQFVFILAGYLCLKFGHYFSILECQPVSGVAGISYL